MLSTKLEFYGDAIATSIEGISSTSNWPQLLLLLQLNLDDIIVQTFSFIVLFVSLAFVRQTVTFGSVFGLFFGVTTIVILFPGFNSEPIRAEERKINW